MKKEFRFSLLACSCAGFLCMSCAREACQSLSRKPPAWRNPELALGDIEPKPRCASSDPGCGPMPIRGNSESVCYRPSQERERLPASTGGGEARYLDRRSACTHDGECNVNGCGNLCTSFRAGSVESNCIGYDWLDEAQFCGCIEGQCSFFKQ